MAATLALEPIVIAAYRCVWGDLGRFIAMAGMSLIGLIACALLVVLFQPVALAQTGILTLAAGWFELAVAAAFSFSWHRLLLAGDEVSGLDALRLARHELRFFGYCILMLLFARVLVGGGSLLLALAFVPLIVAGEFRVPVALARAALSPWGAALAVVLTAMALAHVYADALPWPMVPLADWAGYFALLVPLARILLALPAVVMGERGDLIAGAWQRSRGNGAALFLGLMLCVLPFALAGWIVRAVLGAPVWLSRMGEGGGTELPAPFTAAEFVASSLEALIFLLGAGVVVGFLCFAYGQLIGTAAPAAGAAEPQEAPAG